VAKKAKTKTKAKSKSTKTVSKSKDMPTGVKVLAILQYIGAAFAILFGVIFLIVGIATISSSVSPEALASLGVLEGILGAFSIAAGLLMILLGLLGLFVAHGLWTGKNWARVIVIVFTALGALFALIAIVSGAGGFVSLAIDALIIWYLSKSDVKAAFS